MIIVMKKGARNSDIRAVIKKLGNHENYLSKLGNNKIIVVK